MAEAFDATSLVGTRLGHYLVGPQLGSGSMGQVHRARDLFDGRPVALKLHRSRAEDQALRRFIQEARALGAIDHPGVASVYDAGREGDLLWIAMELCEGRPLAQVLEPGALPWAEALELILPIVEAVASAHRAGVMHRDIKPANMIVKADGTAKLVDFGLAKRIGDIPEVAETGATVWDWADVHTAPGAVLGTPAYMSPEQARAQPVDARADVFALGVILWEAIAGRALYRRATAAATIRAILTEAAPRLDADGRAPVAVAAVVARALENDPARRFRDASELAAVLTPLSESAPPRTVIGAPSDGLSLREEELRTLGRLLARRVRDIAVVGGPAVGKSWLVEHALHALGDVRIARVSGDDASPSFDGVRVVVVDRPRGDLGALRAALDRAAPRASIVRVGPRWVGSGIEHVVELGGLDEDVLFSALPDGDGATGRALVVAVGGELLGVLAVERALRRGESGATLCALFEAPDAWPAFLDPITPALDASLSTIGEPLAALRAIAALPEVDIELAAALLDTDDAGAERVLAQLEAWSLVTRRAGSERWCAVSPLVRRRLEATRSRLDEPGARFARTASIVAARADMLERALDERPSEAPRLMRELAALGGIAEACAARALESGSRDLVGAAARACAAMRRSSAGSSGLRLLRPVLAAGARLGTPPAVLSRGHATLGTLDDARHATALARKPSAEFERLEAAISLAAAASQAGVLDEAGVAADEALRTAEFLGTPGALARALITCAEIAWARSDASSTRRALERAAGVAAQAGDERNGAAAELVMAQLALAMADEEGALASLERAELLALSSRRARIAAIARATLGELAFARGDIEGAREDIALAASHARTLSRPLGRLVLLAAEVELVAGIRQRAKELAVCARRATPTGDKVGRTVALAIQAAATSGADAAQLAAQARVDAGALGRVEGSIVAAWLGTVRGAEPATTLDVLALPPRATIFPGTSLALAARLSELGLARPRSLRPAAG